MKVHRIGWFHLVRFQNRMTALPKPCLQGLVLSNIVLKHEDLKDREHPEAILKMCPTYQQEYHQLNLPLPQHLIPNSLNNPVQ